MNLPSQPPRMAGIDLRCLNSVELFGPELTFIKKRWAMKANGRTPSRGRLFDGCWKTYYPRCLVVLDLHGQDVSTRDSGERAALRENIAANLRFLINEWCKKNDKATVL